MPTRPSTSRSSPQLLDAQRVGLAFAVLLPLAMAMSVAFVPLQVGARSIVFPRLAFAGFWMWLGGAIITTVALVNNGGTLGGDSRMVDLFIVGLGVMAIGLLASAGSVVTTVLTTRAPGMTMRRISPSSWSALVFNLGIVLVMPVFVGTLTYLFVDHRNARTGFGGNEGILDWVGWIFTQPATFLFAIRPSACWSRSSRSHSGGARRHVRSCSPGADRRRRLRGDHPAEPPEPAVGR